MLSNQNIQKLVQEIKKIAGLECSIWSEGPKCLAATSIKAKPEVESVAAFIKEFERSGIRETSGEESFFITEGDAVYVLAVDGTDERSVMAGRFGISHLESLLQINRNRMDKNRFIQNLLLDDMLLVDVYNQAKKNEDPGYRETSCFFGGIQK